MIAGGIGNIRDDQVRKTDLPPGALLVQLGGPGCGSVLAAALRRAWTQARTLNSSTSTRSSVATRRCSGGRRK